MSLLADKVAVVPGAGRGIGRAVALAYPRMGADVACVSRTEENSAKVAAEVEALGRRAWPWLSMFPTRPRSMPLRRRYSSWLAGWTSS
ncbi:MAG: hypothetical protein Ct9H300mP7_5230 [Verrucomicrobiota bacterium]|nr:MAG: hypothetical protein Ct9H300mP7_5230 [Verrucomicrobiota bacterium]